MASGTSTDAGGVNVPVELPEAITDALKQPICADLGLGEPKSLKLRLPSGASIPGINDFTRSIPSNCSLGFSLLLQLGPLLASLECVIKILNLVKPLSDVINGLPFPPAKALKEFGEAVPPVVECALAFTPQGGLPLFIKDVLCLVASLVRCLVDQLESLVELMNGLNVDIDAAKGNDQLLATLECARGNAQTAADAAMKSFEPVLVVLELVLPLIEMAGMGSLEIPAIGDSADLAQADSLIAALGEFADTLELVAGGCE